MGRNVGVSGRVEWEGGVGCEWEGVSGRVEWEGVSGKV